MDALMLTMDWLEHAKVAGRKLASGSGPIVLLLGSGASRSSGGPTSHEIEASYLEKHEVDVAQLSAQMKYMNTEKTASVAPLFDGVEPYLGYRCLAAIARVRKVIVITLAWDDALAQACVKERCHCKSVSLVGNSIAETTWAAAPNTDPGLVCLHLHGRLDGGAVRYYEKFPAYMIYGDAQRHALTTALRETSIVIGVPLPDADAVHRFFGSAKASFPADDEIAVFARNEAEVDGHEDLLRDQPSHQGRVLRAPDLDFDRAMLAFTEEIVGRPFKDVVKTIGVGVPKNPDLILPKPSLLRMGLDQAVVVLVGEPRLGKTTAAAVLAHWHILRNAGTSVAHAHGPADAVELLSASTAAAEPRICVLDDPFDCEDAALREAVVERLESIAVAPDDIHVVVTTSLHPWMRATGTKKPKGLFIASPRPSDWYSAEALSAVAMRSEVLVQNRRDAVHEGIARGDLRTPVHLSSSGTKDDDAVVQDKLNVISYCWELPRLRPIALYLTVARLQELSEGALSEADIRAYAGGDLPQSAPTVLDAFLSRHKFDDVNYVRLAHYTDRVAVDRFLERNENAIVDDLRGRGCPAGWTDRAVSNLAGYHHFLDSRDTADELLRDNPDLFVGLLREWGGEMLANVTHRNSAKGRHALEMLELKSFSGDRGHDFWSRRELIYQVVGDWARLNGPGREARAFLRNALDDRALMGCYSVLEACLCFQHACAPYVRRQMFAALDDRIEDAQHPGASLDTLREVGLAFDALLWRLPPIDLNQLHHTIGAIVAAAEANPAFAGSLVTAALFHGDDEVLRRAAFEPSQTLDRNHAGQARCAADLVKWHFVHQSRGRALFNRRLLESERSGYFNRHPNDTVLSTSRRELIERSLEKLASVRETAGWMVHLALNLRCTVGKFDTSMIEDPLNGARAGDDGVITGALTYEPPDELMPAFRRYFRNAENSARLQHALRNGVAISIGDRTTKAAEPRFRFAFSPDVVWERLDPISQHTSNYLDSAKLKPSSVASKVTKAIKSLREDGELVSEDGESELLQEVVGGNFQPLEIAAHSRRDKEPEDFRDLVKIAVSMCGIPAELR